MGKSNKRKLIIFSEDGEARCFIKQILGTSITKKLDIIDCNLGGDELIHLAKNKIPGFNSPESIIILDGDKQSKINNKLNNFLCLPGKKSPERLLAEYLFGLKEDNPLWNKLGRNYSKQVCFRDFVNVSEIHNDRIKAKAWFSKLKSSTGRNAYKVNNPWMKENRMDVSRFIDSFVKKYNDIAIKINLNSISKN